MIDCLKLCVGDEVTVVIPPMLAKAGATNPAVREPRKRILSEFQKVVLSSADASLSCPTNREEFLKSEQFHRTINQCGHHHVEFNAVVAHHPERRTLEQPKPLPN